MSTFRNKAKTKRGDYTSIMFADADSMPQNETVGCYGFGIEWELCDKSEQINSGSIKLCVCTDSLGQSVRYFGRL